MCLKMWYDRFMETNAESMRKTYEKVKKYIAGYQMIASGDVVVAGVSGGADSVCMLLMLCELAKEMDFHLYAVHVHHGMRADADQDADYVKKLCESLQVPFYLKKVDMERYAEENGLSPEEAGRILRYLAFEELGEEKTAETSNQCAYKIAVAHNRNDRAETMLFHLFRGSGLRGLGSIRPVRDRVIRPLLCLERAEIETYLAGSGVTYCIDSTNDEDTYTRNKIRHHILPYAEEQICKNVVSHIVDASQILAETQEYVHKQAILAYERCAIPQKDDKGSVILDLNRLRAEDPFLQKLILLQGIEQLTSHRKDITGEHLVALLKIINTGGSKELIFPYGLIVQKEYDTLVINKRPGKEDCDIPEKIQGYPSVPIAVPGEVTVPGLGVLEFQFLPQEDFFYKKGQIIPEKTYTKWFDYDKITTVLLLRTRQAGDYLTIDKALRKKSLKEYMINEKIPKMQRERIYLLADGPHILWVPGYRISQYYKVNENTKRILQVRLRGGQ